MLIFLLPTLVRGYEKKNKGISREPFVCRGLRHASRARRKNGISVKLRQVPCVCVCVSKISEPAKYKPLKSEEKLILLPVTS